MSSTPKKPAPTAPLTKVQKQAEKQLGTPDLTEEEPSSSETPSVRAKRDEEHLNRGGILYVPYDPKAPRPIYKTKQTARKRASSPVFPRMAVADKNELEKHQRADAALRQAVLASGDSDNMELQPSTSAGPYYLRSRGQKRKYKEISPSSSSPESEVSVSDNGGDSDDPAAVLSADENADDEADSDEENDDDGSDLEKMDVDPLPSMQPVAPVAPSIAAFIHEDSPEFAEPAVYDKQQPHSEEL
ncbi:uncharacterized protein LOC129593639 [Paramacrobiotus metropolitanus]|uniref:uncharacterized protein LOC129593639 n=1 Tax=Paramacrobiotus metropolitanus TaxID=2943436 RepID=UPI002445F10A|nr:uncharacterized protein LOC129593639 [Paramacrobiotus metropolitanus]